MSSPTKSLKSPPKREREAPPQRKLFSTKRPKIRESESESEESESESEENSKVVKALKKCTICNDANEKRIARGDNCYVCTKWVCIICIETANLECTSRDCRKVCCEDHIISVDDHIHLCETCNNLDLEKDETIKFVKAAGAPVKKE
jgi:hypothetical protein